MNCFLYVSSYFFIAYITSNSPSVNHLWEFVISCFLNSKLLFQNINNLSFKLDVSWIITCWEKKCWWFNLLSQLAWITAVNLLNTKRLMHTSNSDNVIINRSHFESKPNSPAKGNHKELLMSFFLEIFWKTLISLIHCLKVLIFNWGYYFTHIHFSSIRFSK